ncbi:TetR family transcriptional regulator [Enterobacter sp. Bisph1]|uniref:TetR family transcriptional regulator n=1 Tax=Enterobacter sp. Bisph1 TaxID=1274399 RepID=UPI00057C1FE6|nr:TetR family transcriptional regulator [Enterobacter sp. Bisph1]
MRYLNKEDRREVILTAAMRVALAEGLSAMTVRRVASEAAVATGQVHHHFLSSNDLKAQAFIRLIAELLEVQVVPDSAPWRDRLHSMLGSDEGGLEPYIHLWREALLLASKEPEIRSAYLLTMEMWHSKVVQMIEQGRAAGEFSKGDTAQNIAWRLIALVCGLDGICVLGMPDVDDAAFNRHLAFMIEKELG